MHKPVIIHRVAVLRDITQFKALDKAKSEIITTFTHDLGAPLAVVKGYVELIKMELGEPDASGRRRPVEVKGSEFILPTDAVIPAIGQAIDISFLPKDGAVKSDKWKQIQVQGLNKLAAVHDGVGVFSGLHPSGFTDNLVYTLDDINKLNPKTDGIRFGHSVGSKKRKEIIAKAIENKFKIFNARVSASGSKS